MEKNHVMMLAQRIISILLIGSAVYTLGLMIYVGSGWEQITDLLFDIVFGVWAVAPYCYLLVRNRKQSESIRELLILLIGSVLITVLGLFVLYDGFFIHPDAQSGLLFIFIPVYQWIGCGIIAILTWHKQGSRVE